MAHPLVPVLIAAGLAGAVSGGLALVGVFSRRRSAGVSFAWKRYAAERGMRYSPSAGFDSLAVDPDSPCVRAEVHGVAVELSAETADREVTRVAAELPGVSPDFALAIRRRSLLDRLADRGALEEAPTGNKVFDGAFALLSNQPDLARSILDRRLAQVVAAFPRDFLELGARDNRFVLAWRGLEADPAVLDAAILVVSTACRRRA